MTRAAVLAAAAPAKLNLYLHVVGRRDDGYHLLDSLVAFAELGDRIEARPDDRLTLALDGPHAAALRPDNDNLVLRAARALAAEAGIAPRAALRLEKRLPVASGLGGGSADAAAALRALVRLWGLTLDEAALSAIGLSLGADVPVCLYGRPALVRGIGEALAPSPPVPAAPVVLVNPGRALSTPDVFAGRAGAFSEPAAYDGADGPVALAEALRGTRNDLTEGALRLAPEIADALAALDDSGALLARMSGSGATCFGLYPEQADAETAAQRVAEDRPGWWVAASRLAR